MIKLSGVIITYNEERYIEDCLKSLVNIAHPDHRELLERQAYEIYRF